MSVVPRSIIIVCVYCVLCVLCVFVCNVLFGIEHYDVLGSIYFAKDERIVIMRYDVWSVGIFS